METRKPEYCTPRVHKYPSGEHDHQSQSTHFDAGCDNATHIFRPSFFQFLTRCNSTALSIGKNQPMRFACRLTQSSKAKKKKDFLHHLTVLHVWCACLHVWTLHAACCKYYFVSTENLSEVNSLAGGCSFSIQQMFL
jgi:hypothetical protein